MPTLMVCVGLPASGKSTWACQLVMGYPGPMKRVNRDLLRSMMDNGWFSSENEKFVADVEEHIVRSALKQGWNVVVDDTNLDPSVRKRWKVVACDHDADYMEKDFTGVSREQCIERDKERTGSAHVGEDVINRMYYKWLDGSTSKQ